jgi:hypothetical protein
MFSDLRTKNLPTVPPFTAIFSVIIMAWWRTADFNWLTLLSESAWATDIRDTSGGRLTGRYLVESAQHKPSHVKN